jgi:hypothetical protein
MVGAAGSTRRLCSRSTSTSQPSSTGRCSRPTLGYYSLGYCLVILPLLVIATCNHSSKPP